MCTYNYFKDIAKILERNFLKKTLLINFYAKITRYFRIETYFTLIIQIDFYLFCTSIIKVMITIILFRFYTLLSYFSKYFVNVEFVWIETLKFFKFLNSLILVHIGAHIQRIPLKKLLDRFCTRSWNLDKFQCEVSFPRPYPCCEKTSFTGNNSSV